MRENARKQGFGTRTGSILHASRVGGRRVTVWEKRPHAHPDGSRDRHSHTHPLCVRVFWSAIDKTIRELPHPSVCLRLRPLPPASFAEFS